MNIRAAIIHIIGDIIQSIGVVIAALIIFFYPDAHIADPICTLIFTVICIFTTVPIFRDCMSVLMEATPKSVNVVQCFQDILEIEEIDEIHDFHIWSLSAGKLSMSAHIRSSQPHIAVKKATEILREKYQIFHTTIQVERYHPGAVLGCCDNDHEDHDHPSDYEQLRRSILEAPKKDKNKCDHGHDHDHDHKPDQEHDHHSHDHKHGHECNHDHKDE